MKIVVATLLWRRHDVFGVWAEALKDAARGLDATIEALVAGSEGDVSRKLVESHGFHYIEAPNRPLGRKANKRLAACRVLKPDYVILTGSDDIVSPKTLARYVELAREGDFDEVTINDIYFMNVRTGEMAYCPGYVNHRRGEPIAPWRMLNWETCRALGWRGWNDDQGRFLDSQLYPKLQRMKLRQRRLFLQAEDLFVCDLKSEVNLHPWRKMPRSWRAINTSILRAHLSPAILAKLDELKR